MGLRFAITRLEFSALMRQIQGRVWPWIQRSSAYVWMLLCILLAGSALYNLLQARAMQLESNQRRAVQTQVETLLGKSAALRHLDYLSGQPSLQVRLRFAGYDSASDLIRALAQELRQIQTLDKGYGLSDWTTHLDRCLERVEVAHNNWSNHTLTGLPDQYETTLPGLVDDWFRLLGGLSDYSHQLVRAQDEQTLRLQRHNILLALAVLGFSLGLVGLNMWRTSKDMARRSLELNTLHDEVRRDSLTQLLNRRGWSDLTALQLKQSGKFGYSPIAVALLDLDHFKAFNDTHGHDAGDRRLIEFAQILKNNFRPSDVLARIGGEEFAVLMPNCTTEDAVRIIDRIRNEHGNNVPFSAGVVSMDSARTVSNALILADEALYQAKNSGRNRTCTADQLQEVEAA